ncbi:MAG TPA: nickel insertion protein, partial [Pyrinomonadaceae bacterium]|nr:nickel insertion protein [Pyrinomonadaceae bacterium]
GTLLSVLCRPAEREKFLELLFSETTTIGVRSYEVQRRALARETISVQTQFGPIDVKVVHVNGSVRAMPEFEQCRSMAVAANVPLCEVQEAAKLAFRITIEQPEQ